MLGIISAAGDALRAFGNLHPAIKWGVVALAGLLAVEFVGREGIAFYRDLATTRGVVGKTNGENLIATTQAQTERLTANQLIDWQHEKAFLVAPEVVNSTAATVKACREQMQIISKVLPIDRTTSEQETTARCKEVFLKAVAAAQ